MRDTIFQFSMRRSGTHAIAHWIATNGRPCVFFRNCHFYTPGEKLAAHSPIVYPEEGEHFMLEPDDPLPMFELQRFILHSFEDQDPNYCFKRMEHLFSSGMFQTKLPVLIMRDPYNWLASRFKGGFPDALGFEKAIEMYKVHKAYKDEEGVIFINYNKWHTDADYRQELLKALDLSADDVDYDKFYSLAGSKFDNNNVLERYKEVDVSKYIDDELREFAKAEFEIEGY